MTKQQAFEQHWATVHEVPVESMEQYRWKEKDGYRLPDMASAYRNFCAGWDASGLPASFDFTPGKISESDFHMGEAMRLLELLKVEELHRVVIREDLGPMGATPVTWWSTKVGLILEEHSPMGGVSVIVHPAPGFTRVDMVNAARDERNGIAESLIERLAAEFTNSETMMTVECFADWLSKEMKS